LQTSYLHGVPGVVLVVQLIFNTHCKDVLSHVGDNAL
jgi:hypothetical protein